MSMSNSLIIRRRHGFQIDHIGLGVPDTEDGVAWLSQRTGAEPRIRDPEPDQWYWSASLMIADDSFLEVIGPNPAWTRFQPFHRLLASLREPQILFWYIGVSDFVAFQSLAASHKIPIQRVEEINHDKAAPNHSSYTRGFVGPGFLSQRPNVIQWLDRAVDDTEPPACHLTGFRLRHPKSEKINLTFKALGIDLPVERGSPQIGATLATPNGAVTIESPGLNWTGLRGLAHIARLRIRGR